VIFSAWQHPKNLEDVSTNSPKLTIVLTTSKQPLTNRFCHGYAEYELRH